MVLHGIDLTGVGYDKGSPTAPIVMVDFSDFGCPYCGSHARQALPALEREFIATGKVFYEYMPLVMGSFPNGDTVARAAECAADEGKFWPMHDRLYAAQQEWRKNGAPTPVCQRYAQELGLDPTRFAACLADGRTEARCRSTPSRSSSGGSTGPSSTSRRTAAGGRSRRQRGFLDAYEEAYAVPAREVNLVLGVRGTGLPLVLADALWSKYRPGERYAITEPSSRTASTRNLYTTANVQANGPVTAAQTVEGLQRRGVIFLVCDNTLAGAATTLAVAGLGSPDAIRKDLLAGVLPGVVRAPAMVIAFSRLQERGVSYVYAG